MKAPSEEIYKLSRKPHPRPHPRIKHHVSILYAVGASIARTLTLFSALQTNLLQTDEADEYIISVPELLV